MTRLALWGVAKGETELWKESLLMSDASPADVAKVQRLATADGWHHLRTSVIDNAAPNFAATVNRLSNSI